MQMGGHAYSLLSCSQQTLGYLNPCLVLWHRAYNNSRWNQSTQMSYFVSFTAGRSIFSESRSSVHQERPETQDLLLSASNQTKPNVTRQPLKSHVLCCVWSSDVLRLTVRQLKLQLQGNPSVLYIFIWLSYHCIGALFVVFWTHTCN